LDKVRFPDQRFDFGRAALLAGVGALAASIPDWLEPATSPNHRGFFHSIAVLAVLIWIVTRSTVGVVSIAGLLTVAIMGYISHLAADACTRRGLPWI
jgi:membrane-bound metal-dependent hydrolase YbcI (DUF457 family)